MNKKKIRNILILALIATSMTACTSNNIEIDNEEVDLSTSNDNKITNDSHEEIVETIDDEYLILANKTHNLEESYVPEDLTELNIKYSGTDSSKFMRKEAALALENMVNAAKQDGITLIGRSAYRSYNTQVATYKSKVQKLGQEQADKFSAKPGASEHQTGLAIDILSSEYSKLHTEFQHTKTYRWLLEHCAEYGFILRFPKGKSDITGYNFEPWHYRYVGIDHAEKIMSNNLTLEEYNLSLGLIDSY